MDFDGCGHTRQHAWTKVGRAAGASLALLLVSTAGANRTIYVDDDALAGGSGTSWDSAYRELEDALRDAVNGDEIRVAEGVYRPGHSELYPELSSGPDATFRVQSGVVMLGGFRGLKAYGAFRDQRDPELYPSVLSGDQLGNDTPLAEGGATDGSRLDNAATVVTIRGFETTSGMALLHAFSKMSRVAKAGLIGGGDFTSVQPVAEPTVTHQIEFAERRADPVDGVARLDLPASAAVLDGFVIRGGASIGGSPTVTGFFGGGMYIRQAAVVVRGCVFEENTAFGGGAAMLDVSAAVRFEDTTFRENGMFDDNPFTADSGGAVELDRCSVDFVQCGFVANSAGEGGAVTARQVAEAVFEICTFEENTAGGFGGGLLLRNAGDIDLLGCVFEENVAQRGGGVDAEVTSVRVLNNTYRGNEAMCGGGGLFLSNAQRVEIRDSTWFNNTSGYKPSDDGTPPGGGAVRLGVVDRLEIEGSEFFYNSAPFGAAVFSSQVDSIDISESEFFDNTAAAGGGQEPVGGDGGAIWVLDGSLIMLDDTEFTRNHAAGRGGAIRMQAISYEITGSRFESNSGELGGGAISLTQSSGSSTASVFASNIADELGARGGALEIESSSRLISNADMFTANTADLGGAIASDQAVTYIRDSVFDANFARLGGGMYFDNTGWFEVYDSAFRGTYGADQGAGIWIERAGARGRVVRSSFEDLQAGDGAAIYARNLGTSLNSFLDLDLASVEFRAIEATGCGVVYATGSTRVSQCYFSASTGGALCLGGESTVSATTIANVTAVDGATVRYLSQPINVVHSIYNTAMGGVTNPAVEIEAPIPPFAVIAAYSYVPGFTTGTAVYASQAPLGTDGRLLPGALGIDGGQVSALPVDFGDLDNDGIRFEVIDIDFAGNPRRVDDPTVADTGSGTAPLPDIGAFEGASTTRCSPADLAPPFAMLNFADVQAFLGAFGQGLPEADLASPAGLFNFADVQAFLGAFGSGC